MHSVEWRQAASAAVIAFLIGASPLCAANDSSQPGHADRQSGADVGTGWNITTLHASAFQPIGNSQLAFEGLGYSRGVGGFWAPIALPSGAGIGSIGVFANDVDATEDLTVDLLRYTGTGFVCPAPPALCILGAPPSRQTILTVGSQGSPGYAYFSSSVLPQLHTVDNNVTSGTGGLYAVVVTMTPSLGSSLAWKGVDIRWKRQISPAPATASFNDVPANAQFFAEIEAMKAAGITSGCTATTYCPESNVTRRQMAAFFARALGLYWQY